MTTMREDGEQICPVCGGMIFLARKLGLDQCATCDLVLSPSIWQPQANEVLEEDWFESLNNQRTLRLLREGRGLWPFHWLQARLGRGDEAICIARKVEMAREG